VGEVIAKEKGLRCLGMATGFPGVMINLSQKSRFWGITAPQAVFFVPCGGGGGEGGR